jgi:AAA domain
MTTMTQDEQARAERVAADDEPASLSYDGIPGAPRTFVVPGVYALGEVTVDAGMGEVGKGVRNAMIAIRLVLGLPQPGEARDVSHAPGRVLWMAAGSEDDPMHDLAPRFAAAAAACAVEFELDPADALDGLRYVHDLSAWPDGAPVEVPDDLPRVRAEVERLNALDADNRPPSHPDYDGPGPAVQLVIMDPLDAILGPGATIDSRPGARRVMGHLNRFAQGANVAVPVVHHVIASGRKIAGSPAVTNSVRLAFITRPDPANELVKVMTRFKSNVSTPDDIRYVIAPGPVAAFLGDVAAEQGTGGTLRDRIAATTDPARQGTLRDRVRAAAGQREPDAPRVWRLSKVTMGADGTPGPAERLRGSWPDADQAKHAATQDARGELLTWRTDESGREVAGLPNHDGPGRHVVYMAYPAAVA